MSENSENEMNIEQNQKEDPKPDSLGDVLRKERITKRITIETIARDLKLNVKYLKALEANHYSDLPADPYVRVYLKSISKYLMLDSAKILSQYYKERGIPPESYIRDTSTKLDLTKTESERSYGPWMIIAVAVIVLIIISFVAQRQGWISSPDSNNTSAITLIDTTETVSEKEVSANEIITDSAKVETGEEDKEESVEIVPMESEEENDQNSGDKEPMSLLMRIKGDSSWVQVFADGESWKNTLYKNAAKKFIAYDSLNVHVGNNSAVDFYFNGKRLVKVPGKSVTAFKLDRSGKPEKWPISKWNKVFKNRL